MNFAEWWRKSSQQAGEDYYKLRFDEGEINDFRRGLLNPSAKTKIASRVKKFAKLAGALTSGCLILMLLFMLPFASMLIYIYRLHPSPVIAIFGAGFAGLVIIAGIFIGFKAFRLFKGIKADLKNERVHAEQGRLTIKVWTQNDSLHKKYTINNVEFKVLEDAIGAEIHRQFLSPIITVADSRTTLESYRFYYLPLSKLILYYENIS